MNALQKEKSATMVDISSNLNLHREDAKGAKWHKLVSGSDNQSASIGAYGNTWPATRGNRKFHNLVGG